MDVDIQAADGTTQAMVSGSAESAAAIGSVTVMTQKEITAQKILALAAGQTAFAYARIGGGVVGGPSTSHTIGTLRPTTGVGGAGAGSKKALGGSVLAGVPVTVGEHGMETFVPAVNGRISPNGKDGGGKTQNITVNIQNPKREVADEDIRKALKSLSYLGVMQ